MNVYIKLIMQLQQWLFHCDKMLMNKKYINMEGDLFFHVNYIRMIMSLRTKTIQSK